MAGLPSPTDNPMVKIALQSFKRLTATATQRKEPITPTILAAIMDIHGHSEATLADLRIVFVCLVSYAGFLRFDDLANVTRKDCTITHDHLSIHLTKSKSDQFRQGAYVHIARTFNATCPVSAAERYFAAMGDHAGSTLPVLRRLVRTRNGLRPTRHPLSYSRTLPF